MAYIIALAFLVFWSGNAIARDIVVKNNPGGNVQKFIDEYQAVQSRGDRIVIDGYCASACTIALNNPSTCVTKRARLGFHAARWGHPRGPITKSGTAYLMSLYPPKVQAWIKKNGGLGPNLKYLKGKELARLVKHC